MIVKLTLMTWVLEFQHEIGLGWQLDSSNHSGFFGSMPVLNPKSCSRAKGEVSFAHSCFESCVSSAGSVQPEEEVTDRQTNWGRIQSQRLEANPSLAPQWPHFTPSCFSFSVFWSKGDTLSECGGQHCKALGDVRRVWTPPCFLYEVKSSLV